MLCKSMEWFLYDLDLRDKRVNDIKVRWLDGGKWDIDFWEKMRYRFWRYYDKT